MRANVTARARRGNRALVAGLILCGAATAQAQQERRITGRVVAEDSLPLPGVRASTVGTAFFALTDSTGRFTITAPAGDARLAVQRIGIQPDTVLVPGGADRVTIVVRVLPVRLEGIGVTAAPPPARARFDTLAQPGIVTLSPRDILRTPGLLEPDIIRAVQLLPGTVARNDYSIGYNVRGGEADQNLVSLDGVTVFNPSHLGGIFSTFDTDAIDHADFLTSGFPAGYPGRLSSVLDVALRPGDRQRIRGSGLLSLLSSRALIEGPLGPATFLLSGRRTYADQVIKAVSKEELPYYFTDLLGKLHWPGPTGGSLSLTGYWGRDAFAPVLVDSTADQDAIGIDFTWGNRLLGLNWVQPLGAVTLEQHASYSEFATTFALTPEFIRYHNRARLFSARTALTVAPAAGHDVHAGLALERYAMRFEATTPALSNAFAFQARYGPTVVAAFADDQWRPTDRLMVRAGVRAEHVPQARFTGAAPRASFKWFLRADQAITGSAGRYHQAVHSIRDQNTPIAIFESWVAAGDSLPVAVSHHLTLGYERWLGASLQVTVDGYYKTFRDLVWPDPGRTFVESPNAYVGARGHSWGMDLLVRRHTGLVTGWVAYGFGKSARRSSLGEFPPAHDRRHTLNVVLFARGPLGSEMGLRWGLGSPLPFTAMEGLWAHREYSAGSNTFVDSRDEPVSGGINAARFPYYSRLDVGLRWRKRAWAVQLEPYVEIVNVSNRRNVFAYFFNPDRDTPTRTAIYQLPFLLSFGTSFSW